jgi:hypothetical protein
MINTLTFNTGDTITFDLPGGYFFESTDVSKCATDSLLITITSCVTTRNQAVVTLGMLGPSNEIFLYINSYVNPPSTTVINGLRTTVRNSAGVIYAYH